MKDDTPCPLYCQICSTEEKRQKMQEENNKINQENHE